ncbi:MAG: hypothetical protein NTV70_02670 [Acidobacteria bacterium]|nr:hypothetical protein [Acidobacteriota bacterium]
MTRTHEVHWMWVALAVATLMLLFPMVARGDGPNAPPPSVRMLDRCYANTGEAVAATGDFLDRRSAAGLILVNGSQEVVATIIRQTNTQLVFQVPEAAALGRYQLRILTGGMKPQLVDQPVFLWVSRTAQ